MSRALMAVLAAAATIAAPAFAAPAGFTKGPVITAGGAVAKVDSDVALPSAIDWKVDFNVPTGEAGKLNPRIDGAARLINMLAAAGVARAQIHPAIVLHSQGIFDVVSNARYAAEYDGATNPNAALIEQLIAAGVPVYVCGQSAALADVKKSDLLPGVKMALSAMTVHAMLLRQGYTLNP